MATSCVKEARKGSPRKKNKRGTPDKKECVEREPRFLEYVNKVASHSFIDKLPSKAKKEFHYLFRYVRTISDDPASECAKAMVRRAVTDLTRLVEIHIPKILKNVLVLSLIHI